MTAPPLASPNVLILGGGFAGLYAAMALGGTRARVTLVDRRNHHLFQPMLYQVATAALSPSDIASPIRSILRKQLNIEVVLDEALTVDVNKKSVRLSDGSDISYDYLICATGARHSYFGHPEWEALAPGLKDVDDALEIKRRVLLAFERAERQTDAVRRQAELTFVVVGGGPTGVEVAGALAEIRRYALLRDFRHIDSREATVILLEGSSRILSSYPESLSARAKATLRGLGVDVREQTLVTSIDEEAVYAAGWRIPTRTVVWAAGNEVNPIVQSLGAPLDRQGRVIVNAECTIPDHPEVFVLGDAAAFTQENRLLPGVSPVAIQQGKYAARMVLYDIKGKTRFPFRYRDKGQLAVIGRGRAVADIRNLHFSGFLAWVIWVFVHIFFLIGFRNRVIVLIEWGWSYLTYQRGARVITGEGRYLRPESVAAKQ
ncbi:MAG: NAD(P)/FAD-dependent oxidoreductase [Gemmatimonadota bacterium]